MDLSKMKKAELLKNLKDTLEINTLQNTTISKLNEDVTLLREELNNQRDKNTDLMINGKEHSKKDLDRLKYYRQRFKETGDMKYKNSIMKIENK